MLPAHLLSRTFLPQRYRPRGVGAWSGHIPFACDLIAALAPSVLVELGTHLGESYFAFCQAIAESGVPCDAYAVDTWRGDPYTGAYGAEVFREVEDHNRARYGFSRLLRMTFDEAAHRFDPDSIGLLHIDGLPAYDAVRHDFDTWWPKVKPGGIVLLHNIALRYADFGVWRLWDELRQSYPSAEFAHSGGLGVIAKPGAAPASDFAALLFGNDPNAMQWLRQYYELCDERLEYRALLDRRQHPAEWDIITRLFWRPPAGSFSPAAGINAAHTVSPRRSRIALSLPALDSPPAELRLDLTARPAFLLLHGIAVSDSRGEVLWSLDIGSRPERLAPDGQGLLISGSPADSSLLLPLEASALDRLAAGGEIVVEMSGLDPWSYAAQLAQAAHHRRAQDDATIRRLSAELSGAQRLAAERDSALRDLSNAFGVELRNLTTEISRVHNALARRERSLADLAQRLQMIEASLVWRVVRPFAGLRLSVKDRPASPQPSEDLP